MLQHEVKSSREYLVSWVCGKWEHSAWNPRKITEYLPQRHWAVQVQHTNCFAGFSFRCCENRTSVGLLLLPKRRFKSRGDVDPTCRWFVRKHILLHICISQCHTQPQSMYYITSRGATIASPLFPRNFLVKRLEWHGFFRCGEGLTTTRAITTSQPTAGLQHNI